MKVHPSLHAQVVMRHERVKGQAARWQTWRWALHDVMWLEELENEPVVDFATEFVMPRLLMHDEDQSFWLYPSLTTTLYPDEVQGYALNLESPAPCWFVMWRTLEAQVDRDVLERQPTLQHLGANLPLQENTSLWFDAWASPQIVTLSYHEAARWLDAQECVEQVPASEAVLAYLDHFTREHWVDEPKKRRRPQSFVNLEDRFGQPARVSTLKKMGGPRE